MKGKANKSIILRLVVLGVCAYFIESLTSLYSTLNKKQKELNELTLKESQLKNDIEEMKNLLSSDSNDELIEKAARERLGYIFPNEQIYIDISGS